jgi:hypothetical protein
MAMEMAVRLMEMAETAMETDGDGSRGTSPSRQGAGTKTSVPQNLSTVELRTSFWKFADCLRVFCREALYRRRGVIRSGPGWSHHRRARPRAGPCPLMVRLPSGPPPALLWSSYFVREK